MTATASHGQGPATGWPIAAVLTTSPAASAPPATTRPVDGGVPAAPDRQQQRGQGEGQHDPDQQRPARPRGGRRAAAGRVEQRTGAARRRRTAPGTGSCPTAPTATATAPQVAIRRSRPDDQPPASRPARAPAPRRRGRGRRTRSSEQRQGDGDDRVGVVAGARGRGGHEFAVPHHERVGAGDGVRVGRDDPVGDQVAVVGQAAAQRDGEDAAVDRRRPRVDALAAGAEDPRVAGAERDALAELEGDRRRHLLHPGPLPRIGGDQRRVRRRRSGRDDAGEEPAGEQGERGSSRAAPHAATRRPAHRRAGRRRRPRQATVATRTRPDEEQEVDGGAIGVHVPGRQVAQGHRDQERGERAQEGQRPGGQPRGGRDGEERGGDPEAPRAGLVRHVHGRAHRRLRRTRAPARPVPPAPRPRRAAPAAARCRPAGPGRRRPRPGAHGAGPPARPP